ncbi:DUF3159 domain-containing protein [Pseudonocardia sp. KRD-169]|uniref:DUF3159 domain-containing protein n=1 Tax=Pseudonocardia abyssalis TaxID=2792008 RepID=A0ABS6V189_9PSEU|nr:DUF3159 domain-containing protein [Pseudonocardia abyssalis]MBW0137729.1 DUF3159 domain-containing protein [Pseudonocardia abyssalis]
MGHPQWVTPTEPSLTEVLGGRGGAVDATVPVAAFVAGWGLAGMLGWSGPVAWGGGAAVLAAGVIGVVRLRAGSRPRAVVFGLLGVTIAAIVALATGNAADFFLVRLLGNAVSALAWAVSIVVRWPLLGLVVGTALGQQTRWRRDPDLLRGYQRASWVWVGQYVVRLAVFLPLYSANLVVALGVAQTVLTWPLVAICVAASWPLVRSALPEGHGGIRHPR